MQNDFARSVSYKTDEVNRHTGEDMDSPGISSREWLKQISVPVYFLVMLFAVASWIDINGLWVELPLLVSELPEGWSLPSYLTVIIQVANIGPLIYTIANRIAPNRVKEWPVIYLIITIGATACLLLAFFWDHTSYIFGKERSTSLIALSSLLAVVDTTSSVVFLPYMALYKPHYMTAFYVGEGLSGLIPGLVGLVQGVGSNPECKNVSFIVHNSTTGINYTEYKIEAIYPPPLFSVEVFFFFLFLILVVSGISFTFLNFLPQCKKEMVVNESSELPGKSSKGSYQKTPNRDPFDFENPHVSENDRHLAQGRHLTSDTECDSDLPLTDKVVPLNRDDIGKDLTRPEINFHQMAFLLIASVWINALTNGVIPATQSYSSLPYSNTAYTLSVRLSTIANPLACFLALFLPSKSMIGTGILTALGTGLAAYQIALAAMSSSPPLLGTVIGEFLVISTSVFMTGLFSFAKVSVATILRDQGRKALLWCGVSQQIGSFCGAIVAFVLVNILTLFKSTPPC